MPKQTKTLLLGVRCLTPFDGAPDHLAVTLSAEQIEKIKHLAQQVEALDVYAIERFDDSGQYFSTTTLENLCEAQKVDIVEVTESLVKSHEQIDDNGNVQLKQLTIYRDAIRFSATPKHCGDSALCRTNRVLLAELDNSKTLHDITL